MVISCLRCSSWPTFLAKSLHEQLIDVNLQELVPGLRHVTDGMQRVWRVPAGSATRAAAASRRAAASRHTRGAALCPRAHPSRALSVHKGGVPYPTLVETKNQDLCPRAPSLTSFVCAQVETNNQGLWSSMILNATHRQEFGLQSQKKRSCHTLAPQVPPTTLAECTWCFTACAPRAGPTQTPHWASQATATPSNLLGDGRVG